MLRYILVISVIVLSSTSGFGQDEDAYVFGDNTSTKKEEKTSKGGGFNWDRVAVGGGLQLTFGTVTLVEVAPTFGYYLTDNILAGVGANYIYYEDPVYNFNTSIYGGRVFGEYIFENLPFLAHTEAEVINIADFDNNRINIVNVYAGGGLKQSFGGRSYFYILVLWNLNETKESLYFQPPSPIIRGGIAIGL